MLALVTGATGLVGANVVRELLSAGWDVRVTVRPTSNPLALTDLPVQRVAADVEDPRSLDGAVAGCDAVVHAAAAVWVGATGDALLERVNCGGTEAICRAAGEAGVRRLVHISSVDALGLGTRERIANEDTAPNPEQGWREAVFLGCAYARTKRRAEEIALAHGRSGLDVVVVNPAFMLGPWDTRPTSGRMLLAVGSGRALAAPGGGNCFLDVRDAALGVRLALERGVPGRRYILGGENLTYLDAWRRFAALVGARGPVGVVPAWASGAAGRLGGLWSRVASEPEINPITAAVGELPHWYDSTRARTELGFPVTDLDRGVRDAWAWFGEHGYR